VFIKIVSHALADASKKCITRLADVSKNASRALYTLHGLA